MITPDQLEGIVPVNPGLAIVPQENFKDGQTFIGVTEARADELNDECDQLKRRIIGASPTVIRADATVIFSYVARTPNEFAFLVYKLARLMEQS